MQPQDDSKKYNFILVFLFVLIFAIIGGALFLVSHLYSAFVSNPTYIADKLVPPVTQTDGNVSATSSAPNTNQNPANSATDAKATAIALTQKGLDYDNAKDYVDAEASYRKAIATDPNLANAYNDLGVVLDETNRPMKRLWITIKR